MKLKSATEAGHLDAAGRTAQVSDMLYVAVTPAPVWGLVLTGLLIWLTLCYLRGGRPGLGLVLYGLMAVQAVAAFLALALTAHYSISRAACMTGILGGQASILVGLALLGTGFAFWIAKRQEVIAIALENKAFLLTCIAVQIVVTLILVRSAALCTV